MKRVYSILMVFCLMFSLLGNTALASESSTAVVLENAEESIADTVSGNSAGAPEGTVSSGDEQTGIPVTDQEEPDVMDGAEEMELTDTAGSAGVPEVTRVQWLHELTEVFEMSVAEDNYPDNYYSDMNADSEYYYDVMLATEFGLIDTPAGEAFEPEAAATREFAARTLSLCLGYMLEDQTYTYAESATVTYPDDIQIAINRGWFQLVKGAFLPEQAITVSEKNLMLEDAKAIRASEVIDQNYNGSYQFVSDVVVVPEGTQVELTDENQLTIYNCPVSLKVGDKFAVIPNGFPVVHRVAKLTVSGDKTIITFSDVPTEEAFVSLDVQGEQSADLTQVLAADETVELKYIVGGTEANDWEDGEKYEELELVGNQEVSAIEITQEYDIPEDVRESFELAPNVKAKIVCKISDVSCDFKANKTGVYIKLNAKVSFQCNVSTDVLEALGIEKSISLIKIPVNCIGFLTCGVDLKLDGELTFSMSEKITMGVQYTNGDGFRLIKDFQKESFTIQIKAEASLGLKLSFDINYGIIEGSVYAKAGAKTKAKVTTYTDGKKPTCCMEVGAWLFVSCGCEVEVDLFLVEAKWENETKVYDESNSPVRVYFHYEDGKPVSECTRDDEEGGSSSGSSKKYYTPINSQYGYSGINTGTTASGETYTIFDYKLDDKGNATITEYNGNVSALSIPDELDGYTVTGIASSVFKGNSRLRIVVIPDSVTEIAAYAFAECSNLSSVTLSKNLISMGYNAFENCDKLTSIEIPKSLQETTKWFGGPFVDCDGLKTVSFEEGATEVACNLFAGCPGLERVEIPATVTTIESCAFYDCENLQEVVIPDSVTTIGNSAFKDCINLKKVTIPNSVTSIGNSAFDNCQSITKVVIPDSVTEIAAYAFAECSNLSSVTLSKNLISMGYNAFENCDKLTSIEIPKSLQETTKWFGGPFVDCDGLKTVSFEEGATEVACNLFAGCPGLERVEIPATVTTIESCAFYDCENLQEVIIPNSVTTIGNSAFKDCINLKKVTIPNSVTSIGNYAFENCQSLSSITIPDSVTSLGTYVFTGCSGLQEVVLSKGVTDLPRYTFQNCTSLKKVTIPDTVTNIREYAFQNCTSLASVSFGSNLTTIGNYAFNNCDALTGVSLPDSVTSLGTYVFADCELLSDVKLGTGITKIPAYAFNLCSSLQKIVLPYRVTTVDSNAFTNCTKLTEVTIPRSTTTMGSNVFSYPARMTIYGISGTYAEEYADSIGAKFVNQEIHASKVTLSAQSLTLNKGTTGNLVLTVTPTDFTDEVDWKSTDTSVVTIGEDGKLTAKAVGTATIKVTVGTQSASCKVTVVQPVTSISLSSSSLTMEGGEEKTLTATAYPSNANNKAVVWSSSDESIATVDQNGKVTALKKGTAKITATAQDGSNISRSCTVTVTNNITICETVSELESPHNYEVNTSDAWMYTIPGADSIVITFDAKTSVEEDFDYLYLYDKQGNEVGKYTGTELAGKKVTVIGDTVKIKLVSDVGGTDWGFKVTSVVKQTLQVATPTITRSGDKLTIKTTTSGATIYYTTDGSTPTTSNGIKVNATSVTINSFSGHLKAIAVKDGYTNSGMAREALVNNAAVKPVSFAVKGVFGGRNVTFNCATPGAVIYYSATTSTLTLNDKHVNAGETVLFEDFYGTIYARAYYNGQWSNVCRLILKIPTINTPTITANGNGYVTLKTTTPNCFLYYTTDGTTPSMTNGTRISASSRKIYVGAGKNVKVIAVRSCFTNSKVTTGKAK